MFAHDPDNCVPTCWLCALPVACPLQAPPGSPPDVWCRLPGAVLETVLSDFRQCHTLDEQLQRAPRVAAAAAAHLQFVEQQQQQQERQQQQQASSWGF